MNVYNNETLTREELIIKNQRLAYSIANSYHDRVHRDDIESEALKGLVKAADHYNPSRGSFGTCAYNWVNRDIKRYLEKEYPYNEVVSLDSTIDDESETTLIDMIPDKQSNKVSRSNEILDELSKCLNKKEFDILCKVWELGNNKKYSISELSREYKVDRKVIEDVRKKAEDKIYSNPVLKDYATECFCS